MGKNGFYTTPLGRKDWSGPFRGKYNEPEAYSTEELKKMGLAIAEFSRIPPHPTITAASGTNPAAAAASPEAEPGQGPVETKEPGDETSLGKAELEVPDSSPVQKGHMDHLAMYKKYHESSTTQKHRTGKKNRKYRIAPVDPAEKPKEYGPVAAAVGAPTDDDVTALVAAAAASAPPGDACGATLQEVAAAFPPVTPFPMDDAAVVAALEDARVHLEAQKVVEAAARRVTLHLMKEDDFLP